MNNLQLKQLEQSEVREQIARFMGKETRDESERAELQNLTRRAETLEGEIRVEIVKESEKPSSLVVGHDDPQTREIRALFGQASLGSFLMESARETPITAGPENELRAAVFGDESRPGLVPVEMLMASGEMERRADTVTTVAAAALADGSQAPILQRVFTKSIASQMLVDMPSVPVGAANYPILTGGTTAQQRNPSQAVDAAAATFSGATLEPVRLTARYLFRIEDAARLRNYEATLRNDLNMVMSDEMDSQVISGDGAAPNVNGFLNELPAVTDPTAVTTWNQHLAAHTDLVDGLNAYGLADLRCVMGQASFTYLSSLFSVGDNAPRVTALEYVKERIGMSMVSSRIPAAASDIQTNLIALTSYPGRNAVAPIWKGMEFIRDPYSKAAEGEVALTVVMLWNFKVLRETGWSLFKTKVA